MRAFLKPFDGFVAEDFETYSPDRWSSNLYNLQRIQVREKLAALASAIEGDVEALGLEVDHETSAERPSIWNQRQVRSQWVYFFRNARAQKELQAILDRRRSIAENIDDPAHHHLHIVLAVRVTHEGVGVLCGIHQNAWLDRRNAQSKWADRFERAKLLALLERLQDRPLHWRLDEVMQPIGALSRAALGEVLERAPEVAGWIALERFFEASDARLGSAAFSGEVADVLRELADLYRFLAWSKDNDFASMAEVVAEEKKAKRYRGGTTFIENDPVEIVGGLFAGRRGVVQGFDRAGKVKVKVGNLTLPVNAGSLKRLAK